MGPGARQNTPTPACVAVLGEGPAIAALSVTGAWFGHQIIEGGRASLHGLRAAMQDLVA